MNWKGWGWGWGCSASLDADFLETASLLQTWDYSSCEQTAETSLLDSKCGQLELGWFVAIAFFLVFNQFDILFVVSTKQGMSELFAKGNDMNSASGHSMAA